MLKYSCSAAKLVNWVLYQLNDQPGMIFPRKKGWTANIRLAYPGDGKIPYYLVLISSASELIVFIPLYRYSDKSQIKTLAGKKLLHEIRSESREKLEAAQTVFMSSEKDSQKVAKLLASTAQEFSLLTLDYQSMSFQKGNFQNPRLEFRLSSQTLDTELIPNLLPEIPRETENGNTVSLFYQNLFSYLNHCWFAGDKEFSIRSALKHLIPYWNQCRKKDQQETIKRILSDLESVFKRFEFNGFDLVERQKNVESQLNSLVKLPLRPTSKKEMNIWLKKQNQALIYLRDEGKQISIDLMDLESYAELQA